MEFGFWQQTLFFCLFLPPKNMLLFLKLNALLWFVLQLLQEIRRDCTCVGPCESTKWCWFLPILTNPLCLLCINTATCLEPLQPSDFHLQLSPACRKKRWWMGRILFPLKWSQINIFICFIKKYYFLLCLILKNAAHFCSWFCILSRKCVPEVERFSLGTEQAAVLCLPSDGQRAPSVGEADSPTATISPKGSYFMVWARWPPKSNKWRQSWRLETLLSTKPWHQACCSSSWPYPSPAEHCSLSLRAFCNSCCWHNS